VKKLQLEGSTQIVSDIHTSLNKFILLVIISLN